MAPGRGRGRRTVQNRVLYLFLGFVLECWACTGSSEGVLEWPPPAPPRSGLGSFFDCLPVADAEPPASAGSLPRAPVAAFDPVKLRVNMVKGGAVRLRRNGTGFTYVGFLP